MKAVNGIEDDPADEAAKAASDRLSSTARICRKTKYGHDRYVGIEYEGGFMKMFDPGVDYLSANDGIKATKTLLEKYRNNLHKLQNFFKTVIACL